MEKTTVSTTVTIKTIRLKLGEGDALGITGSCEALGNWDHAVIMDDSQPVFAVATIKAAESFEYKFVIADRSTGAIIAWEDGWNRSVELPAKTAGKATKAAQEHIRIVASPARFQAAKWTGAGTAIPVFALRSEEGFGVGEFLDLKKLIDWASATGQSIIQLLPINDTTMTGTWQDSYPYNANSTFALHPQFIHLPAAGVPEDEEYTSLKNELNALDKIDYERVNNEKTRLLKKAFKKTGKRTLATKAYQKFMEENGYWLLPYAAFRVLTAQQGTADFNQWGKYAKYSEAIVAELEAEHKEEMDFHCFEQYHLSKQFAEVKAYAHDHGVFLKGDLPIGISRTSADAWLNPKLFNLDSQAGAPPDAFSTEGQNWGFPTYNWDRMAKDSYAWWKARLGKMSECFDAFRIDHILGFFRIWEIPYESVHGLLGHFNPALPYTAQELCDMGFDITGGKYITPILTDWAFEEIFGPDAPKVMAECLKDGHIKSTVSTQRKVLEKYADNESMRNGLMGLLDDVLFVEDPRQKGMYHPRIGAQTTRNYRILDQWHKDAYNRMYDDFFYRRHNAFWRDSAMKKLPELLSSTDMLACGEDLGMIPDCVPDVMKELQILSLEIFSMPKNPGEDFANVAYYPYMSVCTTSTHDTNPLRAWWEEDRRMTEKYYHNVLGRGGEVPYFCEPWICSKIIEKHLYSPSMLVILPIQDWLSIDGALRRENPNDERINIPAIPRHYWRYRMHITLEQLLSEDSYNSTVHKMVEVSGR